MKAAHPALSSRRSHRRLRAALFFLVPSVLLVTFIVIASHRQAATHPQSHVNSLSANWQTVIDLSAPVESRRTVFPFSVIPGGVRDAKELTAAVSKDHLVANHYSGFKLSQAHTVRLDQPTAMYVSYRANNHIYWTRNRMLIPAGETLISDGENFARVRCGNRLSKIAALPVAAVDPSREQLETPNFVPPMLAGLLPGEGSETLPGVPAALPILPSGPSTPFTAPFTPFVPPAIFPPPQNILPPPNQPPPPVLPPPPPVATPEPGSFVLLLAGALFGVIVALLRK